MDRLKCIGNGQVPSVAAAAWGYLTGYWGNLADEPAKNKQYDARQVLKEYLKRHGDLSELRDENPDAENRSFAWHKHLLPQQMEYIGDDTTPKNGPLQSSSG